MVQAWSWVTCRPSCAALFLTNSICCWRFLRSATLGGPRCSTSFAKFGAPNSPTTLFWQPFSRFRCHSCECGPLSEGFERSVASPLYLVGHARWDARSDRYLLCQTIIPTAYRSQSELPVIEELSEHKA